MSMTGDGSCVLVNPTAGATGTMRFLVMTDRLPTLGRH
jgi:hypothetical protein